MSTQIVIAWADECQIIDRVGRADLGESHRFKTVKQGRACMWKNAGSVADIALARRYADLHGYQVFTYSGEQDPLGRARADVVA